VRVKATVIPFLSFRFWRHFPHQTRMDHDATDPASQSPEPDPQVHTHPEEGEVQREGGKEDSDQHSGAPDSSSENETDDEVQPEVAVTTANCTACGACIQTYHDLKKHPLLAVAVCSSCCDTLTEMDRRDQFTVKEDPADDDQNHDVCSWCGEAGEMLCCDLCPRAFCSSCVTRNMGQEGYETCLNASPWPCFLCNPEPLLMLKRAFASIRRQLRTLDRDTVKNTTTLGSHADDQALLDRLTLVEDELEEASEMLEDEVVLQLRADVEKELRAGPELDDAAILAKVEDDIQAYLQLWKGKHTALSELAASLQEKCQAVGIDVEAFYSSWDSQAASVARTKAFQQAARLGVGEDKLNEAAVCVHRLIDWQRSLPL
jgi:hypothetical protein